MLTWPSAPNGHSRNFAILTPFSGTVDFMKWEKALGDMPETIAVGHNS
jgi:hypothetical protein